MTARKLTYTIEEAAALLGIGRNTAYELARTDALPVPVICLGKRKVLSKAALDSLLGVGQEEAGS